ncbi:MAG TPA: hypothetical protein VJB13_05275 [Candidatus Nanoarchaeia archaeon]|nr:hypothetical protein [Candidatus Nanoarchaeia archaeon]
MNDLDRVLEQQYQLERRYRGFLSSLDSSRTTTLRALVENPSRARERLAAEWLDHSRLLHRLEATAKFFNGVADHERIPGYKGIPLIFLQATNPAEDKAEFKQRLEKYTHLQMTYQHLPPETFYLHTETNFFPVLQGTWRSGQRTITALHPFTSKGQRVVNWKGRTWRDKEMIVGYRIPSYPILLNVSEQNGTDYLTRIIVHDLGHGFLPDINLYYESLHNVTMLYAMQIEVNKELADPWEKLIQAECSNPFFFLDAANYVNKLTENHLSPLQQRVKKQFTSWYVSENLRGKKVAATREEQLEKLWGITKEMDASTRKEKVVETIAEMKRNGFAKYQ